MPRKQTNHVFSSTWFFCFMLHTWEWGFAPFHSPFGFWGWMLQWGEATYACLQHWSPAQFKIPCWDTQKMKESSCAKTEPYTGILLVSDESYMEISLGSGSRGWIKDVHGHIKSIHSSRKQSRFLLQLSQIWSISHLISWVCLLFNEVSYIYKVSSKQQFVVAKNVTK